MVAYSMREEYENLATHFGESGKDVGKFLLDVN